MQYISYKRKYLGTNFLLGRFTRLDRRIFQQNRKICFFAYFLMIFISYVLPFKVVKRRFHLLLDIIRLLKFARLSNKSVHICFLNPSFKEHLLIMLKSNVFFRLLFVVVYYFKEDFNY